ncbi:MAG: ABC transporter ATP-binding protein [Cyclobacteriaceae bacterium]|nr:ABC transporter ATP-binding protein [Cyclobacteriaceae bacterium]
MLEVVNLTKKFSRQEVLSQVSFTIAPDEIVGLIGSNGSGKTTLLNVITGMLAPSGGHFKIEEGVSLGMAISRKGFFSDMSVANNLLMHAQLIRRGRPEVDSAMEKLQIDFGGKMFGKLSAGMKQRVSLAVAWLRPYDLMLLDEPTNHLDINSIISLRMLIKEKSETGTSFLITSHVLTDLEKMCDRILFMKQGHLLGSFQKSSLLEQYGNLEDAYLALGQ